MSVIAAALRELIAAGIEGEALITAIERIERHKVDVQAERRRARDRERKRLVRANLRTSAESAEGVLDKEKSPKPPKENPTPQLLPSGPSDPHGFKIASLDFEAAWKAYPHVRGRSSKTVALRTWKALPTEDRSQMLKAVERYRAEGREPNGECGAPAMERWLRKEQYRDWLEDATGPPRLVVDHDFIARQQARIEAHAKK